MTISVAGLGHQSQLWQWLTKFAGAEGSAAASGAAPVAPGNGNASPDPTRFAQTSAALTTILVHLDTADQAPTFATAASSSPAAPGAPSDASGDTSDSLLTQLEGDLKALFSDLHTSSLSLRTSNLQAPDTLLADPKSNLPSFLPDASGDSGTAADPTLGDSGDSLLAQLESDLKTLFADLQSVSGKPGGATGGGETSVATPDPAGDSPALLRALGAYTAEAGAGDAAGLGA